MVRTQGTKNKSRGVELSGDWGDAVDSNGWEKHTIGTGPGTIKIYHGAGDDQTHTLVSGDVWIKRNADGEVTAVKWDGQTA